MKRTFIIYKITNLINGKIYIGQTVQEFKCRINQHKSCKTSLIGQAIQKYGWDNFNPEVVEKCRSIEELNEREKYWITELNTITPNGYNLETGGYNGIPSSVTRKKKSIAAKKRLKNSELRTRIAKTLTGRKDSDEVRANKSAAQKKRYAENPEACKIQSEGLHKRFSKAKERKKQSERLKKYKAEHPVSEETRRKLSEAQKKRRKKVLCIETKEIFESISAAAKHLNTEPTRISRVCRGVRKTYHGYHLEFVDQ